MNVITVSEEQDSETRCRQGPKAMTAVAAVLVGGEGLFDPGDAYEDENVHGRHALLTWTAVVAKDTGQMSMSIVNLGRTYAEFGTCTPQQ